MKPKHLVKVAAKSVFALIDPLLGPFPGPRILIYHQVGADLGREMEVPTETFRRQLDWMQSHGEIVDLETAIERWNEPDADKLFVLTFDDGFGDVHRNAFPIMKERGIPFTLYLTTNPIETGEPLDPRYPAARPLTWAQVNEMNGTGLVTVGAHTHTHPDLRKLSTQAIADELDRSNRLIDERTGVPPRHFTYPWGWWSATANSLVDERYETATVGSAARGSISPLDLHRIDRLPIQRTDTGRLFAAKVETGAPTEARLRARLQRHSDEDEDQPRVVFVSVTHGLGGPTRSLVTLLESLDGMVERTLVAPSGPFVDMVLERGGAEVSHLMPKWKRLRWQWLSRPSRLVAAIDFFIWVSRHRRSIDCVHANGQAELNIVALSAWLFQIPLVMWAHASEASPSSRALASLWRRLLPTFAIAAVSEDARDVVAGSELMPADLIHVVPNPIGEDVRHISRRTDPGQVSIGYLSGRSALSGYTMLPDVVEPLADQPLRWLLYTVEPKPGAPPDEVRAWSRLEPHVGKQVEMCGKIPDVDQAYARCDIVFCPSLRESFGRVAAEAMTNGIPVVGTDIPPFRRLIGDGQAGLLFPVGDADAAASCIERLIVDPELRERLGAEGRRRAEQFAPSRIAEQFLDLYRSHT